MKSKDIFRIFDLCFVFYIKILRLLNEEERHQVKWVCLAFLKAPSVNFVNILRATFTLVGPKSVKQHCCLGSLFTLSGLTSVKVARKMLTKLSPKSPRVEWVSVGKLRMWTKLTCQQKKIGILWNATKQTSMPEP